MQSRGLVAGGGLVFPTLVNQVIDPREFRVEVLVVSNNSGYTGGFQ